MSLYTGLMSSRVRTLRLRSMNLSGCVSFLRELEHDGETERYEIDLGSLGYVSPFGMLVVSFALRQFRASLPDCSFLLVNHEGQEYAAHMGFFTAFGADFGKLPGEAAGSERYLPVTLLDVEDLRAEAKSNVEVVQQTIERKAHELASVLMQAEDGELVDTLGYAMTEMIRNVVEHSQATQLGYSAQYWPKLDLVEVAILDGGVGIRETLEQNRLLDIESAEHAVHLALLPGVSGKAIKGKRRDPYDAWAHSGYGLYMTSSLCREAGDFVLASGGRAVRLEGPDKVKALSLAHSGTALRLHLRPSRLHELQAALDRLRREGEAVAKTLGNAVPTASLASRLVRRERDT